MKSQASWTKNWTRSQLLCVLKDLSFPNAPILSLFTNLLDRSWTPRNSVLKGFGSDELHKTPLVVAWKRFYLRWGQGQTTGKVYRISYDVDNEIQAYNELWSAEVYISLQNQSWNRLFCLSLFFLTIKAFFPQVWRTKILRWFFPSALIGPHLSPLGEEEFSWRFFKIPLLHLSSNDWCCILVPRVMCLNECSFI